MNNADKIKLSAELVMSVLSTSNVHMDDRLNSIPENLEKIYKKICELDNQNSNSDSKATEQQEII